MELKKAAYRILMLITTPKQVEKTMEIFGSEKIALKYQMSAEGTATSEIMDTLGQMRRAGRAPERILQERKHGKDSQYISLR